MVLPPPTNLRFEHLDGAVLGTFVSRPRLSWWLPEGANGQSSYEIALDDGRRAQVESNEHVLVPWPFEPLRSRQAASVRVRVGTDDGVSEWSRPATVEAGLLTPDDWSAEWVEPDEGPAAPSGQRPAWLLRHSFVLDAAVPSTARMHATAHGIYEIALNGQRVGDIELAPGFTSYATTLHVQTYDVSDLLVEGLNLWEVTLSDGWFRGRHGNSQKANGFGNTVAFLGQLEVGALTVSTGSAWEATTGPILAADLMAGQSEDHRHSQGPWRPVLVTDHGLSRLTSSPAPPVRVTAEIPAVSVSTMGNGRQIIDIGQNINGRLRLTDLGPAGAELTLVHGEALDPTGDVTTDHLASPDGDPVQTDRVVSGGRADESFEPRHTLHGFRFVRVEGAAHSLSPSDGTGIVVHTDLRRTGWFECSDERLNRLHQITDWSFRDNACDIPTDCPQRERSGWTGDWQIFVPTAAYLYDVAGFSTKWLRDLAAEQLDDGLVLNYAPDPRRRTALATGDLAWRGLMGSAGWGDASVIVPWVIHQRYGDAELLAEMWPMMKRWIEFAAASARDKRHPTRVERRPQPLPHEEFLWDGGWHWGEWCEPASSGEPWYAVDQGHVATAFLHHSATLGSRIARILGHSEDAHHLEALARSALGAWRQEYVDEAGRVTPDTQSNLVRALAFGLVPPEARPAAAARLVELIRLASNHLATGFLSTPYLLPVLADTGHLDVAFDVLLQESPPSWLAMVDQGATTVWENWEGIGADGQPDGSLNHYSKGAVADFLHRYVAGIRPVDDAPAFGRVRIAPTPGGGLSWARGAFDSPRGRIEVSWQVLEGQFTLEAVVPPGVEAVVEMPDGRNEQVRCGVTHLRGPAPATR